MRRTLHPVPEDRHRHRCAPTSSRPTNRSHSASFARILAELLHHRFYARIEALKDAYHPLNPEPTPARSRNSAREQKLAAQSRLEDELAALARAANFIPIEVGELDRAFADHSLLKVRAWRSTRRHRQDDVLPAGRVDPHPYRADLLRAAPSDGHRSPTTPGSWCTRRSRTPNTSPIPTSTSCRYRPGSIIIKLFQNVPRDDLEMVFPNVQVRMRPFDKLLIGVPAAISGVIVIVTKLIASIWLLSCCRRSGSV